MLRSLDGNHEWVAAMQASKNGVEEKHEMEWLRLKLAWLKQEWLKPENFVTTEEVGDDSYRFEEMVSEMEEVEIVIVAGLPPAKNDKVDTEQETPHGVSVDVMIGDDYCY